jgi:hypothetical protein
VRIAALFGSAAIAGYTIAIRIWFRHSAFWEWPTPRHPRWPESGAGNPPGQSARWLTGFYNMIFLGLVAVILISSGADHRYFHG